MMIWLFISLLISESYALTVPKMLYVTAKNKDKYNIAGYSSYITYISKMESLLSEKVKESYNFVLQYNATHPGVILSHTTPERLVFLQVLHSLDRQNSELLDFLQHVSRNFIITDTRKFRDWLDASFDFPPRKIQNMVNYIALKNISLTKTLTEQVIYLCEKYKIFEDAVSAKEYGVVKWLLENGIDITYIGGGIFERAWNNGQLDIIKIIMKYGNLRDLNIRKEIVNNLYSNNETLLHFAVTFGFEDAVDYLVKKLDADVNSKDLFGKSPIYHAVETNNSKIVKKLINLGGEVAEELIQEAIKNGYNEIVNVLLAQSISSIGDNSGKIWLFLAVEGNYIEIIKALASTTVGRKYLNATDDFGDTFMHIASSKGFTECVVLLKSLGVNYDSQNNNGETPLYKAIKNGNFDVIKELIAYGADIHIKTESGNSLMHLAASKGYVGIAEFLIQHHIDIHVTNNMGHTPLYKAAKSGNVEIINLLIREGANIYATSNGMTMLHEAAAEGNVNALISLIKSGFGDIDIRGFWGVTPLHLAAGRGHIRTVEFLLKKGSNPNARNKDLWTPMHRAAVGGHDKIVEILLRYSADPDLLTSEGYTPLLLAIERGKLNVIAVLEKKIDIRVKINDYKEALP